MERSGPTCWSAARLLLPGDGVRADSSRSCAIHAGSEGSDGSGLSSSSEIAVSDDIAPQVVETIQAAANTDSIGDGKIFVFDLAAATRIRTGETGDTAL